jgi:predicted kinase
MRTVVMGIGIPGSGKTTLLEPLAKRLGLIYVSPDEIRKELTGDMADPSRDEEAWDIARSRIKEALAGNADVVVDATFRIRHWRRKFVDFLRDAEAHAVYAFFANVPLEVANERNRGRNRVVPYDVLERMHASLAKDPPTLRDGFDAVFTLEDFDELETRLRS